jgi:dihydrolipoamide dehydrogenase
VCIVERAQLGGAGLHNGALSSKALWELSRDYRRAMATDRGYTFSGVELDYNAVCACVDRATTAKTAQMRRQLDALSKPSASGASITLLEGAAAFVDPHAVEITDRDGGVRRVTADYFVVATGSRPRILDSIEVDHERIMTSDSLSTLTEFPKSLVILGAGVVGCEFAAIFGNFGQTDVNLIDRGVRILPFEDEDIASVVAANFESRGVHVHGQAKLLSMEVVDDGVAYSIEHPDGRHEDHRVERALISVGRVPNIEGLGLREIGVELSDRGYIVDDDTQTSVPHVYATGDITQDIALVSVGEIEGRHAAERICAEPSGTLSYQDLSTIMFLDPEVAAIGLNELQARKEKIPYRVARYSYALVNRAIAMCATEGFVKLLVSDDSDMHVLGMRALGVHASTSLEAVALAIRCNTSARELAEMLHPHPAVTEGLQECVRVLLETSVYKPSVFQQRLRASRVSYDINGNAVETPY